MKVLRLITSLFLVFAVVFTFVFGKENINQNKPTKTEDYKGIITLWQIDVFEGGTGSRKQFLMKKAREFEKANPGVLVMACDLTVTGAEEKMNKGEYPDLISFGVGVDVKNFSSLKLSNSSKGGKVGDRDFAVSWCRGNYVLILNPKLQTEIEGEIDNLLISQSEYTNPLTALLLEEILVKNYTIKKPMDAYVQFTTNKVPYFLGTQRDVVRLTNRGMEFSAKPLGNFNDLYQYISITSLDTIKAMYAQKFIDYIVSEKVQSELSSIGMFSEFYTVNYDNISMQKLSEVKNSKTISAFISKEGVENLRYYSTVALKGDKDYLNKIKNILY